MKTKNKIRQAISAAALGIAATLTLGFAQTATAQVGQPPHYIITGSGMQFTATKYSGGYTTVAANMPVQAVIDAVKTDAAGLAYPIRFGSGTPLDIGMFNITFDGGTSGNDWGKITLEGQITSTANSVICLRRGASAHSTADIANTAAGMGGMGILHESVGTLSIGGGTVSATSHSVINNVSTGQVSILGGEILATTGNAISNSSTGSITVNGGTVSSESGSAIFSVAGTVTVSGGRVLAGGGYAIQNVGMGATNLTGGLAFAYGAGIGNVIFGAHNAASGSPVIIAWNQAAGNANYTPWSNTDITVSPSAATAVWAQGPSKIGVATPHGISYAHGANTGLIEIDGVTVNSTSVKTPRRANSANPAQFVQISGRTLQVCFADRGNVAVYALSGAKIRAFDLGQGARTLRLTDLPRGTYLVRATGGAWNQSVRMVVR